MHIEQRCILEGNPFPSGHCFEPRSDGSFSPRHESAVPRQKIPQYLASVVCFEMRLLRGSARIGKSSV